MKALVVERNLPRFAASRVASLLGSGRGAGIGPVQLLDAEAPDRPGTDWYPLRPLLSGICGSDLATLDGRTSRYFQDLVSFPFVPGHEVVGVLDAGGADFAGRGVGDRQRVEQKPVGAVAGKNRRLLLRDGERPGWRGPRTGGCPRRSQTGAPALNGGA